MKNNKKMCIVFAVLAAALMLMTPTLAQPVQESTTLNRIEPDLEFGILPELENQINELADKLQNDRKISFLVDNIRTDQRITSLTQKIKTNSALTAEQQSEYMVDLTNAILNKEETKELLAYLQKNYASEVASIEKDMTSFLTAYNENYLPRDTNQIQEEQTSPYIEGPQAGAVFGIPIGGHEDSDGDGIYDADELKRGTDPNNPDSDGDGVTDGQELIDGTDPNNPNDCNPESEGSDPTEEEVTEAMLRAELQEQGYTEEEIDEILLQLDGIEDATLGEIISVLAYIAAPVGTVAIMLIAVYLIEQGVPIGYNVLQGTLISWIVFCNILLLFGQWLVENGY